jgi:hypothetical protein
VQLRAHQPTEEVRSGQVNSGQKQQGKGTHLNWNTESPGYRVGRYIVVSLTWGAPGGTAAGGWTTSQPDAHTI